MKTLAQQWLEEGKQQALVTSIREGLEIRFATGFEPLLTEIEKVQDPTKLQQLLNLLFRVTSLAEFQATYRSVLTGKKSTTNDKHRN